MFKILTTLILFSVALSSVDCTKGKSTSRITSQRDSLDVKRPKSIIKRSNPNASRLNPGNPADSPTPSSYSQEITFPPNNYEYKYPEFCKQMLAAMQKQQEEQPITSIPAYIGRNSQEFKTFFDPAYTPLAEYVDNIPEQIIPYIVRTRKWNEEEIDNLFRRLPVNWSNLMREVK